MPQKADSTWENMRRKSAALRKNLDGLVKEAHRESLLPDTDAITAYAIINNEVEAWNKAVSQIRPVCQELEKTLEEKSANQSEFLDNTIARKLRDSGLNVFGESGSMVVEGIVHVEVDAKKGSVRVNGVAPADLAPESVLRLVQAELERLKKAVAPPEKLLELLLQAYEGELADENKPFGSQVQTSALFWRLTILNQASQFRANPSAGNFREYPRPLFRADLFTLFSSGISVARGNQIRFSSGSDTAGAIFMLVPQLGRTAHVGRIWFEHTAQ
jgi:hypothetical protein